MDLSFDLARDECPSDPDGPHADAYDAEVALWRRDPAAYWMAAARGIDWIRQPESAFQAGDAGTDWFPGGILNTCANALDRHVANGRGDRPALIWDSPASGETARFTYAQLLRRVAGFAGGLAALGVGKGDRVLISMPPVPEAVIAMLATARLGAVHVFVFAGFAAPELAARIDDTAPRVVVTASCGFIGRRAVPLLPALDAALALATHRPDARVVLNRAALPAEPRPDHLDFHAVEAATPAEPVAVASTDPLYILHTSGTTGRPKGVVRDNGGHAVAMGRSMRMVYGIGPDDVFCTTADLGWVVGHSYVVYAPLLTGCASVLFEGGAVGTPDAGALWRLCVAHRVAILFTSPSALRAARGEDPDGILARPHDLSALRAIFLAGERSDPATTGWAERAAGVPVLDHWWQTETGWAIAGSFAGLARAPRRAVGSIGRPTPGFDLRVLDGAGTEVSPGEVGELVLRLPLPPGCLTKLWNDPAKTRATYFARYPGHYQTFDLGTLDARGRICVISRADDVLKVAGRRLSGGLIEEVLASHPDVVDCAVVGVANRVRGEVPVGFVVLAREAADHSVLRADLVRLVRARIGRFTGFRQVHVVASLPRTKSGKIMRRVLAGGLGA